jgi:hypothetical protein
MDEQLAVSKCPKCGKTHLTTGNTTSGKVCITCRRKQGLVNQQSKRLRKELDRLLEGKELSRNHKKGMLLEYAVSTALDQLGIPNDSNPFDLTYPCYQENRPDIIVRVLNVVIECKNLNRSETRKLNRGWLDANIIERPQVGSFEEKIAVFSYEPQQSTADYLETKGWRTYSIGSQILTLEQAKNSIPRLKQQLCWLREKMKAREKLSSYVSN